MSLVTLVLGCCFIFMGGVSCGRALEMYWAEKRVNEEKEDK